SRPGLGAGLGDFDGHEGGKSNQPGSGDMGPKAWGSGMWDAPMRTRTACVFGGSHNPTPPRLLQPLSCLRVEEDQTAGIEVNGGGLAGHRQGTALEARGDLTGGRVGAGGGVDQHLLPQWF